MDIKKGLVALIASVCFLGASGIEEVASSTVNTNLQNTLQMHESIMIKLVRDLDKTDKKVILLENNLNEKDKIISELKEELLKLNSEKVVLQNENNLIKQNVESLSNTVASILKESISAKKTKIEASSKYDTEFRKFLEANK